MIIRHGTIKNSKGSLIISKLNETDSDRIKALRETLKSELEVDLIKSIETDMTTVIIRIKKRNIKKDFTGLSAVVRTELLWLNDLTIE